METLKPLYNTHLPARRKMSVSDFQRFWKGVVNHKYLYLSSIIICLAGAYYLTKTATPYYLVETSLVIKEIQSPKSNPSNLLLSKENEITVGSLVSKLEEIAVLESYPFIFNTIRNLDIQVSYFEKGKLRTDEIGNAPFTINFLDTSLVKNLVGKRFTVKFNSKDELTIRNSKEGADAEKSMAANKAFSLNKTPIRVVTGENFDEQKHTNTEFEFLVNDLSTLAFAYRESLSVFSDDESSPVLRIQLKTANPEKGKLFLDALTRQYIKNKYEEKSRSASQALAFINEQLNAVKGNLGIAESNLASFRANNTFTDAQEMASRNLSVITNLDEERALLSLNDRYYSKILNDLSQNADLDQLVAPSAVGIQDNLTEGFIKQLADLQLEKNSYTASGGSKNPLVQEIDVKIRTVKSSLVDNIRSLAAANRTRLNQVNDRASQYQAKVYSIPNAERRFTDIKRTTDFNDGLYQFLMQKRVDAGILRASATVEDKILEPPFMESNQPVSPRATNNYILGFLLGVIIPFGYTKVKEAMNKKLNTKEDIQNSTSIPILGTIYSNREGSPFVVNTHSRTAVSESFRILRSNITSFKKDANSKILLVTSSESGEGKSFISVNLASSFAVAKKKTILINLDMRVPSDLYKEVGSDEPGISTFLDSVTPLQDIIQETENPYLSYIATGELPTNPAELLMDNKLEFLLDYLRSQFDYIIIDTPPIGVVADPAIISKFADLNIMVVREKYTQKSRLFELEEMYSSGKLSDVCLVINDVHLTRKEYHNSYYYKEAKKKKVS